MSEDKKIVVVGNAKIQNMIYSVRGKHVMLDSDLAELYKVTTGRLNEQVKRNLNRFPSQFMFQLSDDEYKSLISQNAISKKGRGGRRTLPYVFTEQGIAMLSAVLKSDIAVDVSIKIMDAFVKMRNFLLSNREMFARLDRIELKQLETDKKLEEVFNYIAANTEVKQNIFFDGQIYDAFSFIVGLVGKAKKEIILIDNYVDINTLNILCKKNKGVDIIIATAGKGKLSTKDINKFNAQYPKLSVKTTTDFHDRFLIIDKTEVYHIGASIKDAGKKSFGITKIEEKDVLISILNKVI
ncbi:MAG: ORF6N domain-containing protein [Peptostreptococcus anaerobius]|uniref:ORF6N domain-containing protein n=1 Tax=Peptostreptococcus anaerobius TaxID=1261 RepID=UPI002902686D|nr:ORF6N domain-containing protein [Peptostreptococcus anaerobius]MDU0964035.1 ORF6N domain-containing protein [Peptostreptococcus anaerobius]MDU0997791.1 ORF6N domain-containing protein [Peptostreptococcus anaerobius]